MRPASVPHYFNIFPTGNIPVPVSIGDLPLSDYAIPFDTLTEDVAMHLDNNPLVPGAIVTQPGGVAGVLPRYKMFERLGRRYGVELFLRKPIIEMCGELGTEKFSLKSHLSINMAVRLALSRSQLHIYDPVVVEFEDQSLRLLDMYILLLSQSQLSNNLSGIVGALNSIEMVLGNDNANPKSTLNLIIESMSGVVPAHHIQILLMKQEDADFFDDKELVAYHPNWLERQSIYRSALQTNQAVVLEDVRMVPAWSRNNHSQKDIRSWMGLPLTNSDGVVGLLTLARSTFSPFTKNEKEIAQVFARYLNTLFMSLDKHRARLLAFERKYQIR